MNTNDLINACFEAAGAVMVLNNCRVLYKDKIVRGVSLFTTVFFTAWGLWNVYFYPVLGQMFSFYAGMCICAANILWIGLMMHYIQLEKRLKESNEFDGTPEGTKQH